MVKMLISSFLLTINLFPLFCYSQENSNSKESEYHKNRVAQLQLQKKQYEQIEKDLTEKQKEICLTLLRFREMQLADANEHEMISVCKKFQQLIVQEPKETKALNTCEYALWQIYGPEQPLIYSCSRITEICRDSKTMSLDKKLAEIKRQGDISNDHRIREVAIELYTDNNMYDEAIDYCKEQISDIKEGKKSDSFLYQYQYDLIKTRMLYQFSLFNKAIVEQRLYEDGVINIGPQLVKIDLEQFHAAKKVAEEYINSKYINPERVIRLFSSHLIGDLEEVKKFHNYLEILALSQI